ncbi:MAG: hypothetical protein DSY42_03950 [Aquifex sp.]|nr:MAG: hypothetical protein DSY42_03950 [Aquifex sp.]
MPCHTFLDTGAMVNIISLDFLRKVHPGVTLIEPTHYALQGVTGNQLKTIGKTMLTITLAGYLRLDITAIVVEKTSFPGDLLIEFETMRDEDIAILPAREARCAHKFLPFINSEGNTDQLVQVTQNTMTENDESVTETLNSVAERSGYTTPPEEAPEPSVLDHLNSEHPSAETNTVIANEPGKMSNGNKDVPDNTPDEALKVVSGSVAECTLLQAMSINKVKVELKGIKGDAPVIVLAETSRVKGIQMEAGIYSSVKGKLEIF